MVSEEYCSPSRDHSRDREGYTGCASPWGSPDSLGWGQCQEVRVGGGGQASEDWGWRRHSLRKNSSWAATVPSMTFGLIRRVHSPSASEV